MRRSPACDVVALSVRRREGVASERAAGDEFALQRARLRLARWACIRRVLEGRRSGGDAATLWVPLISVFPQVAESPYSPMCTCGQYPEIRFWDITPDKRLATDYRRQNKGTAGSAHGHP